jgi:hypothetical protein
MRPAASTRAASLLDSITTAPEFATFLTIPGVPRTRLMILQTESHQEMTCTRRTRPCKRRPLTQIDREWQDNPRWRGVTRGYTAADVVRLRGTVHVEHSLARLGAEKLLAQHGDHAVRQRARRAHRQPGHAAGRAPASRPSTSRAGRSRATPTSPARCTPTSRSIRPTRCRRWSRRINNTLLRADQIQCRTHDPSGNDYDRLASQPIVADAEAGFGGVLNAFELDEGHDRRRAPPACTSRTSWPRSKKCGHMGGKVLVPHPARRSASWWRHGSPPTSCDVPTDPAWPAPTPRAPTC